MNRFSNNGRWLKQESWRWQAENPSLRYVQARLQVTSSLARRAPDPGPALEILTTLALGLLRHPAYPLGGVMAQHALGYDPVPRVIQGQVLLDYEERSMLNLSQTMSRLPTMRCSRIRADKRLEYVHVPSGGVLVGPLLPPEPGRMPLPSLAKPHDLTPSEQRLSSAVELIPTPAQQILAGIVMRLHQKTWRLIPHGSDDISLIGHGLAWEVTTDSVETAQALTAAMTDPIHGLPGCTATRLTADKAAVMLRYEDASLQITTPTSSCTDLETA